jgi:succinate dehydrogenase / fumarate reductase flavoprotein subunit
MDKASVFRTGEHLEEVRGTLAQLRDRYANVAVGDKGKIHNMDLVETLELGYMLDCAEALVVASR